MLAKELKYELSGLDAKIIRNDATLQCINEFQLENYMPQLLEQLKVKETRKSIQEQFRDHENSWGFARDVLGYKDADLMID